MDAPGYQIQTNYFEGPLDLLLHLIRKNKLNILEVRLSEITSEYLSYLEGNRGINPSREGDFIITAATLIYIKSRTLLPRTEDETAETPERQLVNTLIEYERIQKISQKLREMEGGELMLWRREQGAEDFQSREYALEEVSAFQLAELFFSVLKKKDDEGFLYIASKNYSIDEKRREIMELLDQEGFLDFTTYVSALDSMEAVVVSFFTLLEMVKRHQLIAVQKQLFGTINLWKREKEIEISR